MSDRAPARWFPTATNYRGKPTAVWLGVAFTAVVTACIILTTTIGWASEGSVGSWLRQLLAMLGSLLLVFGAGLYDDLHPVRTHGLVNQVRLLGRGRLTPGIVKLVVIVAASALVAWALGARGARLVLGVPVVAGTANLWNLLDVAPGRALKLFLPAVAAVGLVSSDRAYEVLAVVGFVAGAGALYFDLREHAMLGDAGSNVLGFMVGIGLLVTLDPAGLAAALVVILILHLLAETVTLSRIIAAVPPLRWFDRLGRLAGGKLEGTEAPPEREI